MDEVKQVIVVRKDLKMGAGKLAAQVAHASMLSYAEAQKKDKEIIKAWLDSGQKKIVLEGDDEKMLERLYKAFQYEKVPCALVNDAGLTQLPPGTTTALGIGPDLAAKIDKFTKPLKLL
ncbi:MAG: peptidyl-tRNA hydrolase Pth2 [Candidatus Micrarchaeota archaeon]|nr:peptidyl-tRNA hydrolase Pth2 [Candidatus Micrarchaeota archaeon]